MNLHSFRKGGMKRISAILLAAMVLLSLLLTGCTKDITDENVADLFMLDEKAIIGTWYAMEHGSYTCSYDFKEDGTLFLNDEFYEEKFSGTYSVENGKVKWSLKCDTSKFVSDRQDSYYGVVDGDVLVLRSNPISHEPYQEGQSVSKFLCNPATTSENMYMSRNKPVSVNQEDVLGAWVYNRNYDDEVGIYIFEKDNTTKILSGETIPTNEILENGIFVPVSGKQKYAYNYNIVLCGDKIYFPYYNVRADVLTRCKDIQITKDMLDGAQLVTNTSMYMADNFYFKDGLFWKNQNKSGSSYYLEYVEGYNIVTLTMEASWATFECYMSDDYVYMINEQIGNLVFALNN